MERGVVRLRRCAAVLSSRWFVLCLAVLVINDRWWKPSYPGAVTGKLSDFAGVAVAALMLAAAAHAAGMGENRAVRTSLIVTAAAFITMKTSETGARSAESVWTAINGGPNEVVADPTDLVALVSLVLVPLVWRRSAAPVDASRCDDSPTADSRDLMRFPRIAAAGVLFLAGSFAVTATSCQWTDSVDLLTYSGGAIVAGDSEGVVIARSVDGGETWVAPPWVIRPEEVDPYAPTTTGADLVAPTTTMEPVAETIPAQDRHPETKACSGSTCWVVEQGRLYREEGDRRVEELAAVEDRYFKFEGCGPRNPDVVKSVAALPAPSGGDVVVAAMGGQGVAVRQGDGEWVRTAVGSTDVPSGFGHTWPLPLAWYAIAFLVAGGLAALGYAVSSSRRPDSSHRHTRPRKGLVALIVVTGVTALAAGAISNEAIRAGGSPFGFALVIVPLVLMAVVAALGFLVGYNFNRPSGNRQ